MFLLPPESGTLLAHWEWAIGSLWLRSAEGKHSQGSDSLSLVCQRTRVPTPTGRLQLYGVA